MNQYFELSSLIVVFEPTGGYERLLREFLKSYKINFSTVYPNKVRQYAKAKGLLAKNDNLDSKLLYDYATIFSLSAKCEYSNQAQEELHPLIKRREQLLILKNQEISRADGALLKKPLSSHLKHLGSQLEKIDLAIKEICNNDFEIKGKINQLTSIPGVGITLATKAICEVSELGKLDFQKLTSLVGLAPYSRDSGQYKGKRSVFAGRGGFRKVLYMAAVTSLRCNPKLKALID